MYQFNDPPPCFLKQPAGAKTPPVPITFGTYIDEVILALPYWRSNDEAAAQAEEILELIDAHMPVFVLRDSTFEALQKQMQLADTSIVAQNPQLVRPSIRFLRVVNNASKKKEEVPPPVLSQEAAQ